MFKNRSNNLKAFGILLWQIVCTALALYISVNGEHIVWFFGQVLLGVSLLQWFVIHHDMIHDSFFKTKILNKIVGHISSILTLLPFFSFKLGHQQHHYWTGWKDKDPSNPHNYMKQPPRWVIAFFNFCWKYWIPLLSPAFVAQNFWNVKRLFQRTDNISIRTSIVLSIAFVAAVYIMLFTRNATFMLHNWLLAIGVYFSISDLVLMSQHSDLDWQTAGEHEVQAIQYTDQSKYTRSIEYPGFVNRLIFYNFNRHGMHHQYPSIPTYQLGSLPSTDQLSVPWWQWLKNAKKKSAYELIFNNKTDNS